MLVARVLIDPLRHLTLFQVFKDGFRVGAQRLREASAGVLGSEPSRSLNPVGALVSFGPADPVVVAQRLQSDCSANNVIHERCDPQCTATLAPM